MLSYITRREPYTKLAFGLKVWNLILRLRPLRIMVGSQVTMENGSQFGDLCLNFLRGVGHRSSVAVKKNVKAENARNKTWTVLIFVGAVVNCDPFMCCQ